MSKIFSRIFHSEQAGLLLALLVLCLVISLLSPVFFTAINIKNVLRDASLIAIALIAHVVTEFRSWKARRGTAPVVQQPPDD